MELRILGPLEVAGEAGALPLSGGKQKALLALLLLNADRVVPVTRIVDDLWGEDVPESAQKMVQIFVSQLRKQLPEGMLKTRAPGYLLDLAGHSLDLHRFAELLDQGRAALAAGRATEASELLGRALALWRGPPLGEFAEPFAAPEAARLEEQHLACLEERIEADLALGRHGGVIGELDALVGRHPHRERPRGQLMLALYRSGRHAEALAAYRSFRQLLAEDLGIEPSAALRELERRMLQQDPALDPAPSPTPTPVAAEPDPEPEPEEMLRLVTVLFAGLVGPTPGGPSRHPEDVRSLMTECFQATAQELRAEGATIERQAGDEVMALFGIPAAREDDALRGVRAARRMLEKLAAWNAERDEDRRLDVRIGVDTGEVIASSEPGGRLLVAGDAVNAAAHLERTAEAGTIVAGERTVRAARSLFAFRELEDSWLVVGEREVAEPRALPGVRAPLVGRAHELGSVRAALERVRAERRPMLVTLTGDAGIGKSRLVAEFLEPLEQEATILIGRCVPSGQSAALAPLADMLMAQAGVFATDGATEARAKIAHLVRALVDADLAADRARVEAALESSLGLETADDRLAALDPRDRFRELIAAWRALLASLARRTPVVAVVEDLHWADATLLDILDELADALEGPVLILCTARPDLLGSRPDWGGGRRSFSSLPLDPLTPEDSGRLLSLLLDAGALTEAARRRILARAEGNPFFLEEMLRHLVDEGSLVHEDGRWRARERIDAVDLPDTVQAVILARLDLLAPDERRIAQLAAVIGRRFWDGAVAALAGTGDLDRILRTLRRREFVVERLSSAVAGEREFVFKHVLIRDVAYESVPRAERGRAHVEAAAWVERRIGDRAGERAEMLAHHYDAAFSYLHADELRLAARGHLLAAAANAHRRFAIDEGDRFARRAVELSRTGEERLEGLEALADLHYLSGDAAWSAYGDALAEVDDDDPAFARLAGKAAVFACRWVGTMRDLPSVEEVHRVLDAGLRAARPASAERALLLVDRAYLLVQREGRTGDAARAAVDEAVSAAEALGDADALSAALDLVQAEQMQSGRYGEMYRTALRRNGLIPRMTDAREIGDAQAMAAWASQHIGRYRAAEEHATLGIERARATDAGSYLHGLTWRVGARFMLGDWDGALSDQAEIERVAAADERDLPASFTMAAYAQAALCHERRGEQASSDRYVEIALRYFEHRRSGPVVGPWLATAPVALALGRRGRFDQALAVLSPFPRGGGAGTALAALCELAAERAAWDEAAELAASARDEAAAGELLALPLYADRLEGRAAAAGGAPERAAELLRRSADGFRTLEARWEEAWSRLLLGEALVPHDRAAAERELAPALAVFEQLRSVREAERTRALLTGVAV